MQSSSDINNPPKRPVVVQIPASQLIVQAQAPPTSAQQPPRGGSYQTTVITQQPLDNVPRTTQAAAASTNQRGHVAFVDPDSIPRPQQGQRGKKDRRRNKQIQPLRTKQDIQATAWSSTDTEDSGDDDEDDGGQGSAGESTDWDEEQGSGAVQRKKKRPAAVTDAGTTPGADGKKVRKRYLRIQAMPAPNSGLCCCELQVGTLFCAGLDCFLASVAAILCGAHMARSKGIEFDCAEYGLILNGIFIGVSFFLLFGAYNRNNTLCFIFLILSWMIKIAVLVLVFAIPCEPSNWTLIIALVLGMLYKIYETCVIASFIKENYKKEATAKKSSALLAEAAAEGSPTVYYQDPVLIPVGARNYGYPYYPYYGYGYDPALGMAAGVGMGMMIGGMYDHCDYYDPCYF